MQCWSGTNLVEVWILIIKIDRCCGSVAWQWADTVCHTTEFNYRPVITSVKTSRHKKWQCWEHNRQSRADIGSRDILWHGVNWGWEMTLCRWSEFNNLNTSMFRFEWDIIKYALQFDYLSSCIHCSHKAILSLVHVCVRYQCMREV